MRFACLFPMVATLSASLAAGPSLASGNEAGVTIDALRSRVAVIHVGTRNSANGRQTFIAGDRLDDGLWLSEGI
jgi:hypothetical protein